MKLENLGNHLKRKVDSTFKRIKKERDSIIIDAVYGLMQDTRVDTSRAVSNWRVSIGTNPSNSILAHFVGAKGSTRKRSTTKALKISRDSIKSAPLEVDIYIFNNIDYIDELNEKDNNFVNKHIGEMASRLNMIEGL